MAQKRIEKELKDMNLNPIEGIHAESIDDEDDKFHWIGTIQGPENTPYHEGVFKLDIRFT